MTAERSADEGVEGLRRQVATVQVVGSFYATSSDEQRAKAAVNRASAMQPRHRVRYLIRRCRCRCGGALCAYYTSDGSTAGLALVYTGTH